MGHSILEVCVLVAKSLLRFWCSGAKFHRCLNQWDEATARWTSASIPPRMCRQSSFQTRSCAPCCHERSGMEWVMGVMGQDFYDTTRHQDLARIFGDRIRTSQSNYLGSSKACLPLIVTRCYKTNFEFFDISR